MSALTLDQAQSIAAAAYSKFLPATHGYNVNNHSQLFVTMGLWSNIGYTPEKNLYETVNKLLYYVAIENPSTFPGYSVTIGQTDPTAFVQSLPSSMVVNFLYPEANAADRTAIVTALDNGSLSKTDFTFGYLKIDPTTTTPGLNDVIKAVTTPGLPDSYPDSGLHMPGVTSSQQDFVVALYGSSFSRAPEYNGMKYWTSKLNVELGYGTDQTTAYAVISKQMYIDGKGNGEAGTTLGDSAYVNFAYQNILGRNGDAAGVQYWNDKLVTGTVDRGSFVAKFVGDAINNAGDSDFLQARIAVSKFAAQEHVSGPKAPGIDLHGVIQNVYDAASANTAIAAIIQKYGTAASPHAVEGLLASWADPAYNAGTHSDVAVTAIELTGTTAQTHDVFLAA